jgi:predicted HTH transcriptional regulator
MYDSTSELLNEIAAGEDMYLELKEVFFKGNTPRFADAETRAEEEIARLLCSFANAEGGVLVFGVNDKRREVIGVPPDKMNDLEQWVVNIAQHNCEPPIYIIPDRKLLPDPTGADRLCLKVDVPKSLYVHRTSGGHWMTRIGSHRADLRPEQLARLLERRRIGEPFEERPVQTATLKALNLQLFEDYCHRRFGPDEEPAQADVVTRLVNLKLAERLESGVVVPTVVGLLLFGQKPISRHLPGAFVDCVCYRGILADANEQVDAKSFHGTLSEQIVEAVRFAERWTPVAAEKTHEGRKDLPAFSLRAVHEAIVNAIVHRDYQLHGSNVRVFLFANRLEVSNPGGLHNTIRPENLFAGCQPYRRNQMLCGFLRDMESPITKRALMEARGEGFRMMVRETRRIGGDVEVVPLPDAVTVILKQAAYPALPENS